MKNLLFVTLLLHQLASAQKIGNGVLNIYKSTGLVSYLPSPGVRNFGTGTLIHKMKGRDSISYFLVTCKHVLPTKAQSDIVYFDIANNLSPSKFSTIKITIFDSSGKYADRVKIDPDGNDLAVIYLTDVLAYPQYKEIVSSMIPFEMLMGKDSIKSNEIFVGDDVLFIGYPSGWYDKRNISPIVRNAVISTPPEDEFYISDIVRDGHLKSFGILLPPKINGFLIDGTAIGGSSGSLVFLKPKIARFSNGHFEYHSEGGEPLILGILAFTFFDPSSSVSQPIKVNLGGVISASSIQKTINLFFK